MGSITRYGTKDRMSSVVVHGEVAYLAGQVDTTATDAYSQTVAVLDKIDALLAEIGSRKEAVLQATIHMADRTDYEALNRAWDAWVPPGAAPARVTVAAGLARPEARVEITVIAAVSG